MTAPTLDVIEGFEHRADTTNATGVYTTLNNPTKITYQTGRVAGFCLRLQEDAATATYALQGWPAAATRYFAGWFKIVTNPTVDHSQILNIQTGTTFVGSLALRNDANGGVFEVQVGAGTIRTGAAVNDGAWHRVELKVDVTGTTWTIDWKLDGSAGTQASEAGHGGSTVTKMHFGSTTAAHNVTVQWDDVMGSVTAGDYDSTNWGANWQVLASTPSGEGTDVIGSTNAIVFTGDTTGAACTDDWASGVADNSTYVTYTSTTTGDAASNYAEVAMGNNTGGGAVWGAAGVAACFAGSAATNVTVVRAVDSGNSNATLTNFYTGSSGVTTLTYRQAIIAAPSTGWTAGFDGVNVRFGFSTDTNPLPRCSAVMFQYAVPYTPSTGDTQFAGMIPI